MVDLTVVRRVVLSMLNQVERLLASVKILLLFQADQCERECKYSPVLVHLF